MAEKITLRSQSPYYDDFDAAKNFAQVLFRPSFPVQSRELTTLQSGLMEQIKRFADFNFKDGSRVSGANISIDTNVKRLGVVGATSNTILVSGASSNAIFANISEFVGKVITNSTGTVKATVLQNLNSNVDVSTGSIYIKYLTEETFGTSGYFYATPEDNPSITETYFNIFEENTDCLIGSISAGVYYVKGVFSSVAKQSIVISETTNLVDGELGLVAQETIVTSNDDATLFDNARGTTNEGAPGAHRLKIDLTLTSGSLGARNDPSYYRIATFLQSVVQETVEIDAGVNTLMDILAERTYDESGDYALKAPNPVVLDGSTEDVFTVRNEPFKAYVRGYQVDKKVPTRIDFSKGVANQITNRNATIAVQGPAYYELSSVTGTIPGNGSGDDPYDHANRLLMKDSGGDTIGLCRAYAVNDEIEKGNLITKLYIYDVKMFQVIEPTAAHTLVTGNDIYVGSTRGYVYQDDGVVGAINGITVINFSNKFKSGQTFTSDAGAQSGTVNTATQYTPSDVVTIEDLGGSFVATVSGTIKNANAQLIYNFGNNRHIKTLKDGSASIMDNDFDIIQFTGSSATAINAANDLWDATSVNDQEEIKKTLKFAYMKIKNDTSRNGANFGWLAKDKEITLLYPDAFKVYGVNETTSNTFATGQFTRLNVKTNGIIPQGIYLTGETSGRECLVVLQNTTNTNEVSLSNTSGYHTTRTGTGSTNLIEVIFTKGTEFIEGENLVARPIEETNSDLSSTTQDYLDVVYNYPITFTSVDSSATGNNINNSFQLDKGQRNELYDVARLVRKDNTPAPSNDIVVFFSYLSVDDPTNKHYYSADSYSEIDFFDYDFRFINKLMEVNHIQNNEGVDLRNVIDFRFRLENTETDIAENPFIFKNRKLYNQSRILPNSRYTSDFTEFLGRIDSVYLDKNGNYAVATGKSSLNPQEPEKKPFSMKLYDVFIPPAVRYAPKEVSVNVVDNKRYTMRDIGKIESRIDRLEEAVALSLLESQALHDDVGGRTKTGFVVDDFSTYTDYASTPADFDHKEFNSTIDILGKNLTVAQTPGTVVPMEVSSTNNMSTFFADHYIKSFTEEQMVAQPNATDPYAINPFAIWTFYGEMQLTPSVHTWALRKENYFLDNNGDISEFVGNSGDWEKFLNITTTSPGGISSTQTNWQTGFKTTASAAGRGSGRFTKEQIGLSDHREIRGRWTVGDGRGRYFRTGVITSTVKFDKPRAVSGQQPTETLAGTEIIENLQNYKMRSVTIEYKATGLAPNTEHHVYFANEKIATISSNVKGEISSTYTVPPGKFSAGTEELKIVDKFGGNISRASANFTSRGAIETYNVVQTVSTQSETTTEKVIEFKEPIAQLFALPLESYNGRVERYTSIITSIDIWLANVDTTPTKDNVTVEIREAVNGYPGGPDKIIGSTGPVSMTSANEVSIPTANNSTNMKFLQPVKLESGKEYAIVLLSPSDKMMAWTAKMGSELVDGSGIHSSQPNVGGYYGSFFVSQNGSTWNAEQNTDLTFALNRAVFDTSVDGTITYANKISDTGVFIGDIGVYNNGLCFETFENSEYVIVSHPNHGLQFLNAQANIQVPSGSYNGLTDSDLNGTHTVYYPSLDSYVIKAKSKATASGKVSTPIFETFSEQSVIYDGILTNVNVVSDNEDDVKVELKTADTNSLKFTIANDKISYPLAVLPTIQDSFFEVPKSEIIYFDNPKIVRSKTNATSNDLSMKMTISSSNKYTSPFWRKDLPQEPVLFRNAVGMVLDDSDLSGLTVTSVTSGDNDDTNQKMISYYIGRNSIGENSSYVTKQIDLEVPADGLTVFFDALLFAENEIDIYYKARVAGDNVPYDTLDWVSFSQDQQINETNYGTFGDNMKFRNFELRANIGYDFQDFKLKIVMKTPNEALVPYIRSLRIIADL